MQSKATILSSLMPISLIKGLELRFIQIRQNSTHVDSPIYLNLNHILTTMII